MSRFIGYFSALLLIINGVAHGQSDSDLKKIIAVQQATIKKLAADVVQLSSNLSASQTDISALKTQIKDATEKRQVCIAVTHNNGANCYAPYRFVVALGAVHTSVNGFAAGPRDIDICCL